MEKSKQNKKNENLLKYGAILILALLIVVGFIVFSGDNNSDITGNVVAKVNGEEITSEEVNAIQQNFMQQGQEISEEDALEQIISQKLISQEMEKGDYSVSTEEAESMIEQQVAMQNMTLDDYKQQIESQGGSYEEQLDSIKEQLAMQKYLETQIKEEDLEVSEEEAKEFYEMNKQQSSEEEIPPYEELESQIIATLQQQKQQQATNVLIQELKEKSEIEYLQEVESEVEETSTNEEIPIEVAE
ncbi:MAG: SurA N-terminal domain-containing protein [Nanoarchaeota archaeon]